MTAKHSSQKTNSAPPLPSIDEPAVVLVSRTPATSSARFSSNSATNEVRMCVLTYFFRRLYDRTNWRLRSDLIIKSTSSDSQSIMIVTSYYPTRSRDSAKYLLPERFIPFFVQRTFELFEFVVVTLLKGCNLLIGLVGNLLTHRVERGLPGTRVG